MTENASTVFTWLNLLERSARLMVQRRRAGCADLPILYDTHRTFTRAFMRSLQQATAASQADPANGLSVREIMQLRARLDQLDAAEQEICQP